MDSLHSPVIQTTQLKRAFSQRVVVDQLNLCVPEGSIYGFLGPNGAGKTTTIRMLLGLIRPTSGKVEIFGKALDQNHNILLSSIGALVETPSLYLHLTGKENLQLIAGLRRLNDREVVRTLKIVDLEKDANRLVKHYSLGMRQRLGLAISLLGAPRLLVLDEPTNGLDPAGIQEVRALIRQMPAEYGISVFVSSHLLNEVEQIASHIAIINAGHLLFQGTAEELRAEYTDNARVATDCPTRARDLVKSYGWQVTSNQEDEQSLSIPVNGQTDVALLVQQMVQAGMRVYHASLERPSLESIFLNLTRAENQAQAQSA